MASIFVGGKFYVVPASVISATIDDSSSAVILSGTNNSNGLYQLTLTDKPSPLDAQYHEQTTDPIAFLENCSSRPLMQWHVALNHLNIPDIKRLAKTAGGINCSDMIVRDCQTCL